MGRTDGMEGRIGIDRITYIAHSRVLIPKKKIPKKINQ